MKEFFKLLKKDLIQNAGFGVLAFLFLVFSRLITYSAVIADAIDSYARYPSSLAPQYTAVDYMGIGNLFHPIVVSVLACCFALLTCFYLHGRKKVDFYHSLPLKKTTVFGVKYLSGIVMFAFCFGLNTVLMTAVSFGFGVLTPDAVRAGLLAFANGFFGFVFIYSAGVFAGLLTATIVTHFVMGTIVMFILPVLVFMLDWWFDLFYVTYYSSIPGWAYCLSPLVYFFERCLTAVYDDINNVKMVAVMAAGSAVFTLIDFGVCKLRRSEAAGSALAFKETNEPLRVIFSVICGALGGAVASFMFGFNEIISFIVGFFIVTAVSSLIIEAIFRLDFAAVVKNKRYFVLSIAAAAVMVGGTLLSIEGYNTYVPKAEKIAEAAVSLPFLQGDEIYREKDDDMIKYFDNDLLESYSGEQLFTYIDGETYVFKTMKITDSELLEGLLSACAAEYVDYPVIITYDGEGEFAAGSEEETPEAEVIGGADGPTSIFISDISNENQDTVISVNVKCTLKSGRTYHRGYMISYEKIKAVLEELVNSGEYKQGLWGGFYNMNTEEIRAMRVNNNYNFHEPQLVSLGAGEAQKIYDALCKDAENITLSELTNTEPLCQLEFYTSDIINKISYSNSYQAAGMYVYPSYENTTEVLKSLGVTIYSFEDIAGDIESINISYYGGDTTISAGFTDRDEINEILDCIYPHDMGRLVNSKGYNTDIEIYTKSDGKKDYYHYPNYYAVFNGSKGIPGIVEEKLSKQKEAALPG
ncbi:MAG: DUF6449 domain-containing protein [Clostridiales bacterium]|nr:DUF6449 domain-containing protein [Clostridiales bacterium]